MKTKSANLLFTSLLVFLWLATSVFGHSVKLKEEKIDAGVVVVSGLSNTIAARLTWHNDEAARQKDRDNSITGGRSDTLVQQTASRLAGLSGAGQEGDETSDGKGGIARAEGQPVPKTERSERRPVATTQFTGDPRQRKESIDSVTTPRHAGKIPLSVRAYPGRSNDGAKMVLGTSKEAGKFAERLRIWRVNRNIPLGYRQLQRPPPSPGAPSPKSIVLPKLERSLDRRAKADFPVVSFNFKEPSPVGGGMVSFPDFQIDGNGKYGVNIPINKVAGVRTMTSDLSSAPEVPGAATIMGNEVNSNTSEWAIRDALPRARRDAGNYTAGTVNSNDNGTANNDSESTVGVTTATQNSDSTALSTVASQSTQGTTRTEGGVGSGEKGTRTGPTRGSTSDEISSQAAGALSSTAQTETSAGSVTISSSSTSASPVSSSFGSTSANPPATPVVTKSPTVTTATKPLTTTAASTITPKTSPPASTQTTSTATTRLSSPKSTPSSSSTVGSSTEPATKQTQAAAVESSTAVETTASSAHTSANSAKTNTAEHTQGSVLSVGTSADGDGSSGDPLAQASSIDSLPITQDSAHQVFSTAGVTPSTESGSKAAETTADVAAESEQAGTSTDRVSRSPDPTPAPTTSPSLSTSSASSTTTSSSPAVEIATQPSGPSTQSPDVTPTDQSAILAGSFTTEGSPPTVTSDLPADASTDDMDGEDPIPEGGPYPEPTGVADDASDAADAVASAEPGPDWPVAKMVWGEAWELHLYFFGGLFGLLGLYTLVSVLRLWSIHRLLSRRYFVSLNLLMLLLCSTRAVYLLLDGYNSNRTFHPSLDYFLYSISFPCLSSAFSIQLYALLQATKMQFLPPTIQKMSMLIVVTVFHFAISIATDVVVGMYAGMRIMLFVCQLFFILWGLFLFFGYAYIFRRLYLHAVKRQKNVIQKTGSYSMTGSIVKPKSKFTLSVAVKVTFSTAILGLVTVGLEVYGMVGVYKTFSDDQPEPWPFYIYHTTLRLIEFLMCASMSYVASQPFRYRRRRQCCCCPVLCAPCAEICCCGADVNRSNSLAGWSDIDQHQLRTSFDRGNVQNVSFQHDGVGNGHGITRNGSGGGDMTVAAKTRIYFKDRADVMPIVTSQPTSASTSRPTSANSDFVDENTMSTRGSRGSVTGSIDGTAAFSNPYRAVHSPSSDNRRFFPTSGGRSGVSTSTPVKARDGVVNIAYSSTTDDPQSPGFAGSKSRNGSIASSDFFHAPSVSLADSMASELDKAFRSMHEDETPSAPSNARAVSTPSLPSLDEKLEVEVGRKGAGGLRRKEPQPPPAQNGRATCPESSIQRFLQQQQQSGDLPAGMVLRRSRSAIGRCSFQEVEPLQGGGAGLKGRCPSPGAGGHSSSSSSSSSNPWHVKLFRSRSDNTGGIRTRDVDNARYMLLPDVERSDLLTHTQQTHIPSTGANGTAPGTKGESIDHSRNTDATNRTTASSNYPKNSLASFRGNHGAYGGNTNSDTNASSKNRSPGDRHSGAAGRLKYRDDDSDDIEV